MKIFYHDKTESLKELLTEAGYSFPCGGKGLCGRCKIIAPSLPVTPLDRRFFTDKELQSGVRLACDKTVTETIEIECLLPRAVKKRRLEYPQVAVLFTYQSIDLLLFDNEIVDTVTLPYETDSVNALRAAAGKHSVEFFEKYNAAKAVTIMAGGENALITSFTGGLAPQREGNTYPASDFDMPAEDVYLLPSPGGDIGSDVLLELMSIDEGALLVDAGRGILAYKGESIIICRIGNVDFSVKNEKKAAFFATLAYFIKEYHPETVHILSDLPNAEEAVFKEFALSSTPFRKTERQALQNMALALSENKYRTRLNKLCRRTEIINPANEESWQTLFTEVSK